MSGIPELVRDPHPFQTLFVRWAEQNPAAYADFIDGLRHPAEFGSGEHPWDIDPPDWLRDEPLPRLVDA